MGGQKQTSNRFEAAQYCHLGTVKAYPRLSLTAKNASVRPPMPTTEKQRGQKKKQPWVCALLRDALDLVGDPIKIIQIASNGGIESESGRKEIQERKFLLIYGLVTLINLET